MDLDPIYNPPCDEGHESVSVQHGRKHKCDQMKEFHSDRSCNALKLLRTNKYHREEKRKSNPELIRKASASTSSAAATTTAKYTPQTEKNKATHINLQEGSNCK